MQGKCPMYSVKRDNSKMKYYKKKFKKRYILKLYFPGIHCRQVVPFHIRLIAHMSE